MLARSFLVQQRLPCAASGEEGFFPPGRSRLSRPPVAWCWAGPCRTSSCGGSPRASSRPFALPGLTKQYWAGDHFALLLPSELMQIVLDNLDAWQQNRQHLLQALRLCEGAT